MKSREQTAIEALKAICYCCASPPGLTMRSMADAALKRLAEMPTPPAQGSIDLRNLTGIDRSSDMSVRLSFASCRAASQFGSEIDTLAGRVAIAQGSIDSDGLPPLPACKLLSGPSLASLDVLYTADQMRAYVLADRAAIHSNEGLLELALAQLKERLAKADAQIERLESAARQSAAPDVQGSLYEWRSVDGKQHDTGRVTQDGSYFATTASPKDARTISECLNAHRIAAPAPSEPVPQVVPEGWKLVPIKLTEEMHGAAVRELRGCTGNGDFPPRIHAAMLAAAPTSPTATSGGEAVYQWRDPRHGGWHDACKEIAYAGVEGYLEARTLYLAPPPLPATDAASVREVPTDEALEIFFNEHGFYPNNLGDTTRFFEAIRALISKETTHG